MLIKIKIRIYAAPAVKGLRVKPCTAQSVYLRCEYDSKKINITEIVVSGRCHYLNNLIGEMPIFQK